MDDLSDLPEAVRDQLSRRCRAKTNDVCALMLGLFTDKPLGIDGVLIGMWREHKLCLQRPWVMNRLYRMAAAGLLEPVPTRKGAYTIAKATGQ